MNLQFERIQVDTVQNVPIEKFFSFIQELSNQDLDDPYQVIVDILEYLNLGELYFYYSMLDVTGKASMGNSSKSIDQTKRFLEFTKHSVDTQLSATH